MQTVKAITGLSVLKQMQDFSLKHLLLVPSEEPTLPEDVTIEESLTTIPSDRSSVPITT